MYIEILILVQLNSGQKHGYEIKKDVQSILGKNFSINNNMLYPILKRFEDMGAVQKQIQHQEGKPNRHLYTITSIGTELLFELLQDFPEEIASNDNEFLVRVGLFDILDSETHKKILLTRRTVVEKNLNHTENIVKTHNINIQNSFHYKVIEFLKSQMMLELMWISKLEKECEGELI
jgi:DNA-binding PadR family transcriptional regulator